MLTELIHKNRLVLINKYSPRIKIKPTLFLDRDGVVINDFGYISDKDSVTLRKGIKELITIASPSFNISIVTNQSGIERGFFGWEEYRLVTAEIMRKLGKASYNISSILACGSIESSNDDWRKPGSGMIKYELEKTKCEPSKCIIIGDKKSDMEAGNRIGIKRKILLTTKIDTKEVICDKKYYQADEGQFRSSNILGIIHCFKNKFK